jgi:hypothetical protein
LASPRDNKVKRSPPSLETLVAVGIGPRPAQHQQRARGNEDGKWTPEGKEALKWALKLPIQKRGPKWMALKPNPLGKEAL